ncbi:hypothetical protein J5N97_019177 [Dioscorea zingiberensis]|uniref:Uncharacterized protein n=1 Tax=Dioscorea zingiberensis TaxID=325984 RepID=A0A9D5CDL9_9LILI|nr:hypothetical protein J5N97_019177 [Dioscorea zingiberensis]
MLHKTPPPCKLSICKSQEEGMSVSSVPSMDVMRCRSLGRQRSPPGSPKKKKVAPEGCVSVYVGVGRERYFVRTECLNHPLFKKLLDDAEMEYGYATEGPLKLPCDVDLFQQVLWEMEMEMEKEVVVTTSSLACSFSKTYSRYQLLSPSRPMAMHG